MAKTHKHHKDYEAVKKIIRGSLNPILINKQKLNEEELEVVVDLHAHLHFAKEAMKKLEPDKDQAELHRYVTLVEEIEFEMQEAWGFEQNRNYHTHWYSVPHCVCPKMDNQDYFGSKYRIITETCPVHGGVKNENI